MRKHTGLSLPSKLTHYVCAICTIQSNYFYTAVVGGVDYLLEAATNS